MATNTNNQTPTEQLANSKELRIFGRGIGLNPEEVDELVSNFREFDKDGSATVSRDELEKLFAKMLKGSVADTLIHKWVSASFQKADTNSNNDLDILEFLKLYSSDFVVHVREAKKQAAKRASSGSLSELQKKEAAEQAKKEAQKAAEEKAKREANEKTAEAARKAEQEKAKREADEKAKREADEKAKRGAAEKAKREAEEKAKKDAEAVRAAQAAQAAQAATQRSVSASPAPVASSSPTTTRTVVYVRCETQFGEFVFLRGGLPDSKKPVKIVYTNKLNNSTKRSNELSWNQPTGGDWTTRPGFCQFHGPERHVGAVGFGNDPENKKGAHNWKFDFDMPELKSGDWFEFRAELKTLNGEVIEERGFRQTGAPVDSPHHFGRVGFVTYVNFGEGSAELLPLNSERR